MGICDGFGDGLFFWVYHMILKHAFSMIFLEVGAAQRNKDGSQSFTEMHLAKAFVFRFFGGFWPASDLWGVRILIILIRCVSQRCPNTTPVKEGKSIPSCGINFGHARPVVLVHRKIFPKILL